MATIISAPISRPAIKGEATLLAEFRAFWRAFFVKAFNPYRPELHYMRGPGPACRAKQMALSPAVRSMLAISGPPRRTSRPVRHDGRRFLKPRPLARLPIARDHDGYCDG